MLIIKYIILKTKFKQPEQAVVGNSCRNNKMFALAQVGLTGNYFDSLRRMNIIDLNAALVQSKFI